MVDVIVFDLGKVILDFDLKKLSAGFASNSKKSYPEIINLIYNHWELVALYEKGRLTSEDFYLKMRDAMMLNIGYRKFCGIWNGIFSPIDGMIDFVKNVSEKYNTALLSNTNELHFEFVNKQYDGLFAGFKQLHLSYKMNARKPEKEIYEQVIDFYAVSPGKIFFTDDVPQNVEAAKKLKINAFLFDGIDGLKYNLNVCGIKI